jgi:two-component system, chemotaxis family, protein-glutamate methylesterase/glutaminase
MPKTHAANRIVVMGGSAGGIQSVCKVLAGLPADFPFPVLVVIHISSRPSLLPGIFSRCGPLSAVHPQTGAPLEPDHVYVAPPNHHLVVKGHYIQLTHNPREHWARPALDDGVAGLSSIKARGGVTIVQDPSETVSISMPRHALEEVKVDYCLQVAEIAPLLVELSQEKGLLSVKKQPRN